MQMSQFPTDATLVRRGFALLGLGWTALVAIATWQLAERAERGYHDDVRVRSAVRLGSLVESLSTTFRQLEALPVALSRQRALQEFLAVPRMSGVAPDDSAGLAVRREWLLGQSDVVATSSELNALAQDFNLSLLYLLDHDGTVVADSSAYQGNALIGGNFSSRGYFHDALERGRGAQFLIGRLSGSPGFYFSARVDLPGQPAGVLVVKQEPTSMQTLFGGFDQRALVTDVNGVVVLGSPSALVLKQFAPARTGQPPDAVSLERLYKNVPEVLPWRSENETVDGRTLRIEVIDGLRHVLVGRQVDALPYTAWVLLPLDGEAAIWQRHVSVGLLAVLLGLLLLVFWARRERLNAEVERARNELLDLANALPLTVFRYHRPKARKGYFTFIGHGAEALFGRDVATIAADPAMPWRMMGTGSDLPPVSAVELPIRCGDDERWLQSDSTPSPDGRGGTLYNGYWSDITERKLAEAKFRAVFEYALDGYFFVSVDEGVLSCNPATLQLFGVSEESGLLGRMPWLAPLSPPQQADGTDSASAAQCLLNAARLAGRAQRCEWCFLRSDGSAFTVELAVMPILQGTRQLYGLIAHDVTLKKQAEQAMRDARDAAQAAASIKSSFLANMSHEIRTPMNAILGMTHLALRDDMAPRQRNYVEKAHRAARGLLAILNDVLDLSKIESGRLEIERVAFRLDTVVDHMVDVIGVKAEEKDIELLFSAQPGIPTALIGDPVRLGQVLINLGSNAIKFSEHGDVIIDVTLEARDEAGVELHFSVADCGIGMDEVQLARLFQPFTQADSSITRRYGGTGLGLTISRQLVELMHGRIWAESRPGEGSVFHFTARFGLQALSEGARAPLARELAGARALVVDDHEGAREVLQALCGGIGLEAQAVAGGEEALATIAQAPGAYRLVLIDWKMPHMDGLQCAAEIRSRWPLARMQLILVTALGHDDVTTQSAGQQFAAVLHKPVTTSALLDAIAHATHGVAAPIDAQTDDAGLAAGMAAVAGARVLLVEDNELNQELARDLLERAGVVVESAADGLQALDILARDQAFDVVLMDCQMPVLDGYSATREIRAQPALAALPVIAMTASVLEDDRQRMQACGMNDYIPKPLDVPKMFATLARWVGPALAGRRTQSVAVAGGEEVPQLPHLDRTVGLSHCMDKPALYRRVLRGFIRSQHDFSAQFARVRADADTAAAARLVHTLRGLAGTIGADALARVAATLEQQLQAGAPDDGIDAAAFALTHELEALLGALQGHPWLAEEPGDTRGDAREQPDTGKLAEPLRRLRQLLADCDAEARTVALELTGLLHGTVFEASAVELQEALERYDFDQAGAVLGALCARAGAGA
ncbi:MAG: response regulator [Gammaproteobacteria bacterium]|jgi:two-component system, sensor histidine kinase and response regulator|nr:response regulator [Gammaproteobacteria bacterium]MBU0857625.1 response regulator [Gammaproteobacteria bacterium]MBU1848631.1 response regulator [Gammaproteobacteria bacterium]